MTFFDQWLSALETNCSTNEELLQRRDVYGGTFPPFSLFKHVPIGY